jgi:hypothetical protein
MINIVLDGNQW